LKNDDQRCKKADKDVLVALLLESFRDVAEKFGFVQKSTKKFDHLPFIVAFMYKEL